jgi:serine/threonine protein kinase
LLIEEIAPKDSIYIELLGPQKVQITDIKEGGFALILIVSEGQKGVQHSFKILKKQISSQETMKTELLALSRLEAHPNVVEIEGYSNSDIGYGILMPYYPTDLSSLLSKGLDLELKLNLLAQTLNGLGHLHRNGILHLDLKPGNILLDNIGNAAVTDFGISTLFEKVDIKKNKNLSIKLPDISGTLLYMAPEQLVGHSVSVATDIFSFGTLAYQLLTGDLPWKASTAEQYAQGILNSSIDLGAINNPSIPKWASNIVKACLNKDPERRPSVPELLACFSKEMFDPNFEIDDEDFLNREVNRASVLVNAGDTIESEKILRDVLSLNPWHATARVNFAELLFIQGAVSQAIVAGKLAISIAEWSRIPAAPVLYLNLSFYLMIENPIDALRVVEQGLTLYPDNWELLHNHAEASRLAYFELTEGHSTRAKRQLADGIRSAERALKLMPRDVSLRETYAGLLRNAGERDKFVACMNGLLEDAAESSIQTRLLYIDGLLDDGALNQASKQIDEISKFDEFRGLLDSRRERLHELQHLRSTNKKTKKDTHECCWHCKFYRRELDEVRVDGAVLSVCYVDRDKSIYPTPGELNPGEKIMPPSGTCRKFQIDPPPY